MPSQRKIQSARANGAKSHGPKTPEGRRKSSMNALKHGLTANNIVLTIENRQKFESLRQAFLDQLQPANQIELDLVDQMVSAHWRLDRMMSLETASLDLELVRGEEEVKKTFEALDDDTRLAIAFKNLTDNSHNLAIISRYEARFRRNYERAVRLLYELRGTPLRPAQPLAAAPVPAEPPAPESPLAPAPGPQPAAPPDSPPVAAVRAPKIRMPNEPNPISGHSAAARPPAAGPVTSLIQAHPSDIAIGFLHELK